MRSVGTSPAWARDGAHDHEHVTHRYWLEYLDASERDPDRCRFAGQRRRLRWLLTRLRELVLGGAS